MAASDKDPFELKWFEIRALMYLHEKHQMAFMRDVLEQFPLDIRGAVEWSLHNMAEEELGMVILMGHQPELLVELTPKGRAVLFETLATIRSGRKIA
jgi:hypothetical protein